MHSHRVAAPDGWILDVLDLAPDRPPRAIVVAGHAMMVDRRTFRPHRPGLARTLVDAGSRGAVQRRRPPPRRCGSRGRSCRSSSTR